MFTRKEKDALNDIARSIQEVYKFSLIPEDKNFKRPRNHRADGWRDAC